MDSIKPKHRSDQLTVAQFAQNYKFNVEESLISMLQSDETRFPTGEGTFVFEMEYGTHHDGVLFFNGETKNTVSILFIVIID